MVWVSRLGKAVPIREVKFVIRLVPFGKRGGVSLIWRKTAGVYYKRGGGSKRKRTLALVIIKVNVRVFGCFLVYCVSGYLSYNNITILIYLIAFRFLSKYCLLARFLPLKPEPPPREGRCFLLILFET